MIENVKNNGEKTTYTFTSKDFINKEGKQLDPFYVFEQFFGEKKKEKEEISKAENSITNRIIMFLFMYVYPIIPFVGISSLMFKKIKINSFISGLIIFLYCFSPLLLWLVAFPSESTTGYTTYALSGLIISIVGLIFGNNVSLARFVFWVIIISIYTVGYYQLYKIKNTTKNKTN